MCQFQFGNTWWDSRLWGRHSVQHRAACLEHWVQPFCAGAGIGAECEAAGHGGGICCSWEGYTEMLHSVFTDNSIGLRVTKVGREDAVVTWSWWPDSSSSYFKDGKTLMLISNLFLTHEICTDGGILLLIEAVRALPPGCPFGNSWLSIPQAGNMRWAYLTCWSWC